MKRLTDEIDHKVLLPTQNTKVARVLQVAVAAAHAQPYEIQRDPTALGSLLARLAAEQGAAIGAAHAVTMTAELSQMFRIFFFLMMRPPPTFTLFPPAPLFR